MAIPGKLHGPGIVSSVPELFSKAMDYVGAIPPPASGTTALAPSTGFGQSSSQVTNTPLTEDELRFIAVGMLSGIPQVQRYIVDHYCMPDVEFVFINATVRGRDNFYHVYRAATTAFAYKTTVRDVILSRDKACMVMDLKIKPRPLPLGHRNYPCVVIMHFATDPADGRTKITLQHDHHTTNLFHWYGGLWSAQVVAGIIQPLAGWYLVAFGWASDYVRKLWKEVTHQPEGPCPLPAGRASVEQRPAPNRPAPIGPASELDACIRQATEKASLSVLEDEDRSSWESWGMLGYPIRLAGGLIGLWVGQLFLALAFTLQFVKPV